MAYKYTPSKFMLPTSHYDQAKADRAVAFIQNLCHTKGRVFRNLLDCQLSQFQHPKRRFSLCFTDSLANALADSPV